MATHDTSTTGSKNAAKIIGPTSSNADPSEHLVNTATKPVMANKTFKFPTKTELVPEVLPFHFVTFPRKMQFLAPKTLGLFFYTGTPGRVKIRKRIPVYS